MNNIIEIKQVTKKYGNFTAVNNISLGVKNGETFGILGPNGAGKTTTLEMIETLRSITKGEINVNGISVRNNPEDVKQIIGVQLQSSTYFERLTLKEIINLFATFYGLKVDAEKLLADVDLESKKNAYVENLSGGQKQRFSIASTLVNNPKVVFLDEPTTGLDPQARRNIWELINNIRGKGQTIVITTHYMEEAELLCDRIAIMNQGKIIDLDTPYNLIKNHGSGTVISFNCVKDINKKDFSKLKDIKNITISDHHCEISTQNEMNTLKDLLKLENKYEIKELILRPSTLEDVFLNLTGKKLKE